MPFHSVTFGSNDIRFKLQYSARKTLGISVLPDLSVIVTAPDDSDFEKVKDLVKKRAPWIIKQQSKFNEYLPAQPERKYVGGETHLYLGRQYRLKVREGGSEEVKLKGRYIYVMIKNKNDRERIKELLDEWYKQRASKYFRQKLIKCFEKFRRFEIEMPAIALRRMTKRWGTCSTKGTINLNPDLIKFPASCVEYVIVHELCHLIEPNHSREFYQLLQRIMPDWTKRKLRLEGTK
jgi:predicted metal-dependent hydrolase